MSKINLPLGSTGVKVVVQPVVLFSVCDAFIRRGDGQSRVIGTLLGTIEAGVIDLRLSYAVPHIETPESVSDGHATATAMTCCNSTCCN
jgi:translation initiation factor 3 subunit F